MQECWLVLAACSAKTAIAVCAGVLPALHVTEIVALSHREIKLEGNYRNTEGNQAASSCLELQGKSVDNPAFFIYQETKYYCLQISVSKTSLCSVFTLSRFEPFHNPSEQFGSTLKKEK